MFDGLGGERLWGAAGRGRALTPQRFVAHALASPAQQQCLKLGPFKMKQDVRSWRQEVEDAGQCLTPEAETSKEKSKKSQLKHIKLTQFVLKCLVSIPILRLVVGSEATDKI